MRLKLDLGIDLEGSQRVAKGHQRGLLVAYEDRELEPRGQLAQEERVATGAPRDCRRCSTARPEGMRASHASGVAELHGEIAKIPYFRGKAEQSKLPDLPH